MTKIKVFLNIIIITLFFFIVLEILSRSVVFLITKKISIFKYGFDKDIILIVNDMSNFEFYLSTKPKKIIHIDTNLNDKKKEIWVFGGSSSTSYCSEKNWTQYLKNIYPNYKIVNYARPGKTSDYSLGVLESEIDEKKYPSKIFWAHKINELFVAYWGLKRNSDVLSLKISKSDQDLNQRLYFLHSLALTIKKNIVSFYLLDEVAHRVKLRLAINEKLFTKISDENMQVAAQNFSINTNKALKISKKYKLEDFYLVSLIEETDIMKKKLQQPIFDDYDKFYIHYNKSIKKILKQNKNIAEFIDLPKLFEKNKKIKLTNERYFCDRPHQLDNGHLLTFNILKSYLENN